MRLSPNFSLAEMTAASTRQSPPDAMQIANLRALCDRVLEPVRALLGVPLRVTSGYRSREHNAAINGSATSQHCLGLAADVVPVGMSAEVAMERIAVAVKSGALTVDQGIVYPSGFLHLSWSSSPRNHLLRSDAPRGSHGPYRVWAGAL